MQAGEAGEVYPLPRPPLVPLSTNILLVLFYVRVYMLPQVVAWRACVAAPPAIDLEVHLEHDLGADLETELDCVLMTMFFNSPLMDDIWHQLSFL